MAASGSGSLECEESGLRGLRVIDRSEPTSHRNLIAWFSVTIAFGMSVGMGLFVLGPFETMDAMARSDVENFAAGLGLHHKAPYVRLKQPGEGARPHLMVMSPSRTMGHAALNMFTNPAVPLANMQQNHDKNMVFHKIPLGPLNRETVGPKPIRKGLIRGRWTRIPQPVRLVARPDEGEMEDDNSEVSLIDPETGYKVDCTILNTTIIGGKSYSAMIPRDVPATIKRKDANELVEIVTGIELKKLFPLATAVCKESNIDLLNTAVTFTLSGDPKTIDDLVEKNKGWNRRKKPKKGREAAPPIEDFEAEVVVPFVCEAKKYFVMRLNDPVLLVGRQVDGTTFEIPSEDEMEDVGPKLESIVNGQ